jgi:hypothetical protein
MLTGSWQSVIMPSLASRDIDLVVQLAPADARRSRRSSTTTSMSMAMHSAGSRRTSHGEPHPSRFGRQVDLVMLKNTPYRLEEFQRRRVVVIEDAPISIVAPENLVLSKLLWMKDSGSEMQRRDVRNLVESVPTLDRHYIETWAQDLSVLALWREVAA